MKKAVAVEFSLLASSFVEVIRCWRQKYCENVQITFCCSKRHLQHNTKNQFDTVELSLDDARKTWKYSRADRQQHSKMLSTKNIKENILAIEYPGIVKNVDYALNTMGGLTNISRVVSLFSGHLSNSFRKLIFICCTHSAIGKQPREETFGLEFSTGKHLLQTDFRRRQTNDGTASESSTSKEKIKDGKC